MVMRFLLAALAGALMLCFTSVGALADDWVAAKLRGTVFQYIDGDWAPLVRGDVVPDNRVIRTLQSGRVTFQRDGESIEVGPRTQIQIVDRTGRRYTTVKQHYGTVTVEANVENVEHFAVETPHLAAVVKGTIFEVTSSDRGSAVEVTRGRVQVEDLTTHVKVVITAGQNATVVPGLPMGVDGRGELPVPVNPDGTPQDEAALLDLELNGDGLSGRVGVGDIGVNVGAGRGGIDVGVDVGGIGVDLSVGDDGIDLGTDGLGDTVGGLTDTVGDTVDGVTGVVGGILGGLF